MKCRLIFLVIFILVACKFASAEFVTIEDEKEGVATFRLSVTPAAEPDPIFRIRLTTPRHELKRGNAPAYYRRTHAVGELSRTKKHLDEETDGKWEDWYHGENTLNQLPLEKLAEADKTASYIVEDSLRPGTLCRRCDWGLAVEDLRGPEAVEFLLPEFQGMRDLARLVALRTRFAIREQRYDDAVEYLRMNYRMGRDTGKVPFLVCVLIGNAITGVANDNVRDLIASPDSRNMYWALTELPAPLVPLYEAGRFEMSLGLRLFPLLADAETARRTPEEWNELTRNISGGWRALAWGDQKELVETIYKVRCCSGRLFRIFPRKKQVG